MNEERTGFICPFCEKSFNNIKKFQSHIGWHKGFESFHKNRLKKLKEEDEKTISIRKFICERCGKEFDKNLTNKEYSNYLKNHKKIYCSRSCANKKKMSQKTKEKISLALQKTPKIFKPKIKKVLQKNIERKCKVCDKIYTLASIPSSTKLFCSKECYEYYRKHIKKFLSAETLEKYRECGFKLVSYFKNVKRSKNEVEFCNLCKNKFKNVVSNEPFFNGWDADIIIHDLKIAVLWNGPWHYKKLTKKHSVEQVQNRDKIKINEILKARIFSIRY